MKKFLLSLNLILAILISAPLARCEESFLTIPDKKDDGIFLGVPYDDTKNKPPSNLIPSAPITKNEAPPIKETKKKGLFSRFSKKSEKFKPVKKYNPQTNKMEEIPQGYYGTLPDIEADFKYKKQRVNSARTIEGKLPQEGDLSDENLKPAPYDDTLFLDVIVKKEKSSNYINDLQKTKFALNNLKKCIENNEDIQRFNGCVNMLDLYTKNLKSKYQNQSESLKESYSDILSTTYHSKVLGNLIYDANYYSRYIPTAQGKYSKENIELQKRNLLNKINKTLFIIANES